MGLILNTRTPNPDGNDMTAEQERLLFENHDLRQRLSLVQESLIEATRKLNNIEGGAGGAQSLQRELVQARSRIAELEAELATKDARIDELSEWGVGLREQRDEIDAEKTKLWEWAAPQLALLDPAKPSITAAYPVVVVPAPDEAADDDRGEVVGDALTDEVVGDALTDEGVGGIVASIEEPAPVETSVADGPIEEGDDQ